MDLNVRDVELVSAERLSPSVRGLTFELRDQKPIVYVPGQWLNVFVPVGSEIIKRPYSVASAPNPKMPHRFEIAVTRVEGGPASCALDSLPIGGTIQVDTPTGFFTRDDAGPALFVCTGTGLSPIRAMLQAALVSDSSAPLTLLFGCRTEEDRLWASEWHAAQAQHPLFRFEPTLSQADASWMGRRGYVQTHLREFVQATPGVHVYICGLSKMVQDVRRVLKEELGLDRKHIHTERYD